MHPTAGFLPLQNLTIQEVGVEVMLVTTKAKSVTKLVSNINSSPTSIHHERTKPKSNLFQHPNSGPDNLGTRLSFKHATVKGSHWFRNFFLLLDSSGGNEQAVIIVFPNHLLVRASQREPLFEPN